MMPPIYTHAIAKNAINPSFQPIIRICLFLQPTNSFTGRAKLRLDYHGIGSFFLKLLLYINLRGILQYEDIVSPLCCDNFVFLTCTLRWFRISIAAEEDASSAIAGTPSQKSPYTANSVTMTPIPSAP